MIFCKATNSRGCRGRSRDTTPCHAFWVALLLLSGFLLLICHFLRRLLTSHRMHPQADPKLWSTTHGVLCTATTTTTAYHFILVAVWGFWGEGRRIGAGSMFCFWLWHVIGEWGRGPTKKKARQREACNLAPDHPLLDFNSDGGDMALFWQNMDGQKKGNSFSPDPSSPLRETRRKKPVSQKNLLVLEPGPRGLVGVEWRVATATRARGTTVAGSGAYQPLKIQSTKW